MRNPQTAFTIIALAAIIAITLCACVPVSVGLNYVDEKGRNYGGSAAFGDTKLPTAKKFTK